MTSVVLLPGDVDKVWWRLLQKTYGLQKAAYLAKVHWQISRILSVVEQQLVLSNLVRRCSNEFHFCFIFIDLFSITILEKFL